MFRIFFKHFPKNQTGQDLAEYGLLIGLIALVVVAAIAYLGGGLDETFNAIGIAVSNWRF